MWPFLLLSVAFDGVCYFCNVYEIHERRTKEKMIFFICSCSLWMYFCAKWCLLRKAICMKSVAHTNKSSFERKKITSTNLQKKKKTMFAKLKYIVGIATKVKYRKNDVEKSPTKKKTSYAKIGCVEHRNAVNGLVYCFLKNVDSW